MFTPPKQYPRDILRDKPYNKRVRNAKECLSEEIPTETLRKKAALLHSHGKAQNAAACDNDNGESL